MPDFGPTMNVIAYSPFQEGGSAVAMRDIDTAIASDPAQKATRLRRRSRVIGFSSGYMYHRVSVAEAALLGR